MRLLLGSGGLRSEARRAIYYEQMASHFEGCSEIVFIPYASSDYSEYSSDIAKFSEPSGVKIRGIETFANPIEAIEKAEGIYVGGGNTFLLTKGLHENGILDIVRKRVSEGMPYMGVSAGANVACPTMQTTNDMPIVQPPSFETFALLPFQINPHYHEGTIWMKEGESFKQHFGETRTQRIQEFHEYNNRPVIGLWEGAFLRWDGDTGLLIGGHATVFRSGSEPVTFPAGTEFDLDLVTGPC
ncbi:MAG TPA: dipeptidase PepE [Candidatus Thalassarchaeaceae archaeon]|nr:dipeptidase PepE [Candidatus Thalassarchaeaceae archaeon]